MQLERDECPVTSSKATTADYSWTQGLVCSLGSRFFEEHTNVQTHMNTKQHKETPPHIVYVSLTVIFYVCVMGVCEVYLPQTGHLC